MGGGCGVFAGLVADVYGDDAADFHAVAGGGAAYRVAARGFGVAAGGVCGGLPRRVAGGGRGGARRRGCDDAGGAGVALVFRAPAAGACRAAGGGRCLLADPGGA